ncbi:MAG: gluconokinase [Bacteroidota bacterium]
MVVVVIGVSGSGKTTVGKLIAEYLPGRFIDADDFHPQENIDKMSNGTPLTDVDRVPWLLSLREEINKHLQDETHLIMACSALKKGYREVLGRDDKRVKFIYLSGTYEDILPRMEDRQGHYMKADMLQSQFEALEIPSKQEAEHYSVAIPAMDVAREVVQMILDSERSL